MRKQNEKQPKRVIPAFATEAEEAEWRFHNRHKHGKPLLAAIQRGEARVLTKEKLRERIAASKKTPAPVVALRIPEADLALARKQAERKGLPYQTYIKSPAAYLRKTKPTGLPARRNRSPEDAAACPLDIRRIVLK